MDASGQDLLNSSGRILRNMFLTLSVNDGDLDQHMSNPKMNTKAFNNPNPSGSNLRIIKNLFL